jgi:hypothetical protein
VQPLELKTASVISTVVIVVVLVIFIAPQVDLDPTDPPADKLFFGLLLVLATSALRPLGLSKSAACSLVGSFVETFCSAQCPPERIQALLC